MRVINKLHNPYILEYIYKLMVERKAIYTEVIDGIVDKDMLYEYMTFRELPLTEALVYHMVKDLSMEKSLVAKTLNVSMSRISHAYKKAIEKV